MDNKKPFRVNYFDIGSNDGRVTKHFAMALDRIGVDYTIFAFEPVSYLYDETAKRMLEFKNINIYKLAIADKEGEADIHICVNGVGHSLFGDHPGIKKGRTERVKTTKFSKWLLENYKIEDFVDSFNILKINIEGSEYAFFRDMIGNDLLKHFNVICGDDFKDIGKVGALASRFNDIYAMIMGKIKENNISYHRVTRYRLNNISLICNEIIERMKTYGN